ncbi:MAG: hypothetical protein ACFCBW_14155 [Candidatus Competibacterales bacterium]
MSNESVLMDYLRDGALCALVLVKGAPEQVASAVGTPAMVEDAKQGVVARLPDGEWSWLWLKSASDMGIEHPDVVGYEAIVLLNQVLPALSGDIPDVPLCMETPITSAQRISQLLGVEAIAVWGSDQGNGIGGATWFDSGQLIRMFNSLDPELTLAIKQRLEVETLGDDEDDDESRDELEALVDEHEGEHYALPIGRYVQGELNEVVDEALREFGFDLDLLAEYLPDLLNNDNNETDVTDPVGIS